MKRTLKKSQSLKGLKMKRLEANEAPAGAIDSHCVLALYQVQPPLGCQGYATGELLPDVADFMAAGGFSAPNACVAAYIPAGAYC